MAQVGIIGGGRVGLALATSLFQNNKLAWLVDISVDTRTNASKLFQNIIPVLSDITSIPELPNIIFITVNDNEIHTVSEELMRFFGNKLNGKYVIHCSGSLTANTLRSCSDEGAIIAAAHPYQTFYSTSIEILNGIAWGIECTGNTEPIVELIELIGGKPIIINGLTEEQKALYHCSAVVASNFITPVLTLAGYIAKLAGIAPEMFIPQIVKTTIDNNIEAFKNEQDFPLTGPFARGDIDTIKKHIAALGEHKAQLKTYCWLGLAAAEMAKENGLLNEKDFLEIKAILLTDC